MGLAPVLARPRATLSLPSQRGAVNWLPALIFSGTILAATSVLWTVFKSVGCSISMAIGESPRVGWELLQRYFSQLPFKHISHHLAGHPAALQHFSNRIPKRGLSLLRT